MARRVPHPLQSHRKGWDGVDGLSVEVRDAPPSAGGPHLPKYVTKAGAPHHDFELWASKDPITLNPGLKCETWGTLIALNSDLGHPPLTPYEYLCKCWQNDPNRFTLDPTHQMPGLYT